ncbi:GNAT family N-acetyltransferase [Microbacterium sp. TNHR37B]|uniref:GNAT family N-acetyltransferase n=1 Tax=Microbacterium sp. TNHR37B TaxID=1775956 RepID=UPI0007B2103B|nr:GNAT family N-acetyltransferase [Microbacterium sp. TNHR37B]KZE91416.1 Enhanced intracellular survival protein [Microbacterium sp. TNHR37B]
MTTIDGRHHDAPLDSRLLAEISDQGLRVARVDEGSRAQTDAWLEVVSRGFLDGERTDVQRDAFFAASAYRRKLGVYDDAAPIPEQPVATFASWTTELSTPGDRLTACAISSVTVAPTHRRRGLLRSLMSGELRTAAELGLPVATLTVSESSIYGRFGFAPAVPAAHWRIDPRRAGWRGPLPGGRIDFLTREQGRAQVEVLHDRIRPARSGEVQMPGGHWDRFFGTRPDVEKAGETRVLQYRSAEGSIDGLALYRVSENHDDFAASTLDVVQLLAATDDAYAALWRFLLSMDLIGVVRASELAVDEPLWWMITDQRAVTITLRDHHYLRILDVPTALAGRRYDAADTLLLDVHDPLGITGGAVLLEIGNDGTAAASPAPAGAQPDASLGIEELSALFLGGVSALALARAGRLRAADPHRIDRVFRTSSAPRLSFWY